MPRYLKLSIWAATLWIAAIILSLATDRYNGVWLLAIILYVLGAWAIVVARKVVHQ